MKCRFAPTVLLLVPMLGQNAHADGSGVASDTAPNAAPCTLPAADRPPDPRCGETLDGRVPAGPSSGLAVSRAALLVPRLATRAILWPVVETSDVVEHYRLLDWLRAITTTDDGKVGIRPIINYSTTFLPTGGARFFYRRLPGTGSEIAAQFQTAGSQVMSGRLEWRTPSDIGILVSAIWDRRDDRLFAGLGPNSLADLKASGRQVARFGSDNFGADLHWSRRLPWRLVAYAHGDLLHRDYTASSVHGGPSVADVYGLSPDACTARGLASPCVDEQQMAGFYRGLRIAHAGGGMGLGLRDPGREGAGASLVLDGTLAQGVAGDPSRHATFWAETVLAIGAVNRTFLLRGRAAMVEQLGDAPVPFEELVSPSGQAGMRGFAEGRLRGESGLVGTAEYRWYISSYLDASLFTDLGTVAGRGFSGIVWDRWFPTFGLGFRLFKTQGPYWEATARSGFQLAYAPDGGFRILLSMAGF